MGGGDKKSISKYFISALDKTLDINSHETKKILELQRRYRLLFAQQVVPKES